MKTRRLALGALTALIVTGGGLSAGAASSSARAGYTSSPSGQFGEPCPATPCGNGQLTEPLGVAVNDATGDVYVVDSGNNRVQEFDAQGKYLTQFNGSGTLPGEGKAAGSGGLPGKKPTGRFSAPNAIAVDNSTGSAKGDVYVADVGNDVIDVFGASGKYLSQITGTPAAFTGIDGVAVDPAGNVFVYDSGGNEGGKVDEFDDTGAPITGFNTGRATQPGLAVDSKDDVYVLYGCGCVGKLTLTAGGGTQVAEWGSGATALAVNATTGNVFVDRENSIQEFAPYAEPDNEAVSTFGLQGLVSSQGLAVDAGSATVYASERSAGEIDIFKSVLLADVSGGPTSAIGKTSATVSGTVKRDGLPAEYHFEYGETSSYGSSTPATDLTAEEETLSASLSGLQPGTTYHYRIAAANENGTSVSSDQTFTTPPAVDELSTGSATAVASATATLTGSLAPDGVDTHYYFEYGESEAYGSTSPALPGADAGSASTLEHISSGISGLEGSTTYHYRLLATNSFGTTAGADATFTTLPALARVADQPSVVSGVTRTTALVLGTVDDENSATEYHVEYVDAGGYQPAAANPYAAGASTEVLALEPAHGDHTVGPLPLQGLLAGTTYHYRLVASNGAGIVYGPDYTLTTAAATAPRVTTGAASEVTQTGVMLAGVVDPQQLQTSYEFEVGTDTSYDGAKLFGSAGSNGIEAVSASLQFLIPGTTYHYRLVASNEDGTTYGQDMVFTTPDVPTPISQPTTLPMVPSPTVVFPAVTSAITKAQGTGKKQAKPRRRAKARKRSRAKRKRGAAHARPKHAKGGTKGG